MLSQEIKDTVDKMSPEERSSLASYLQARSFIENPEYQAEMDDRLKAVKSGEKVSSADVRKLHQALLDAGQ